jgi:Glycosyl transferase family 2
MPETLQPLVSIIMPTYNRAAYIIESIRSVQGQTYTNWELIIVDDGSDDETEQLITELKDQRIQFLKAGRIAINGKIKNIGILKARGEFIAFIDSDDLWHPEKMEKQVAALKEYPEAAFSLTGGYNFRILHQPVEFFYKQSKGVCYGDVLTSFFESKTAATIPSLLFRKNCVQSIGYFEETGSFSDIGFILKLASHFKAAILYEHLLFRRLHHSNDNDRNWIRGYDHGAAIIHSFKKKLTPKIVRNALFRLYINFGEDHLLHKNRIQAIGKFLTSWKYKPYSIIPLKKAGKAVLHYWK